MQWSERGEMERWGEMEGEEREKKGRGNSRKR